MYIEKDVEDIEAYLKADRSRPDLGTPPREVCVYIDVYYTHVVFGLTRDTPCGIDIPPTV